MSTRVDVAIIGGGIAGLAVPIGCGRRSVADGRLFEASDRSGGKVQTERLSTTTAASWSRLGRTVAWPGNRGRMIWRIELGLADDLTPIQPDRPG